MDRRAYIVAGAAGPIDAANLVLGRLGFAPAEALPTLTAAVARMRIQPADLVIVPLDGIGPNDLSALEREVARSSGTSVIGVTAHLDPDLMLRALHSGVSEFVTSPPDSSELAQAVERLLRKRTSASHAGTVVAVYSANGGMGTTTCAVNLAYALAPNRPDSRIALVDFVVVGGDVRVQLNLKPSYDIGDVTEKLEHMDAELLLPLLSHPADAVWALPSSDNEDVHDLVDGNAAASILEHLRSHFGYVVVDTEHFLSERTLAALDAADRIVLLTQLTVPALRSAQRTLKLFARLGYPEHKTLVVVNRFNAADALSPADARDVLHRDIFWKIPNDYHASSEAVMRGVPVTVSKPKSAIARGYLGLAAAIGGKSAAEGNGDRTLAAAGAPANGAVPAGRM